MSDYSEHHDNFDRDDRVEPLCPIKAQRDILQKLADVYVHGTPLTKAKGEPLLSEADARRKVGRYQFHRLSTKQEEPDEGALRETMVWADLDDVSVVEFCRERGCRLPMWLRETRGEPATLEKFIV